MMKRERLGNEMTGIERREGIIKSLQISSEPVSGAALAKYYEVSRQVIVQDIALIRAAGYDVISTHRGYMIQASSVVKRILKVMHTDEQLKDELQTIVDLGGTIVNVKVRHKVYGEMQAPLHIRSRKQIQDFLADIKRGKSSPLMNITSNYHYHTVCADDIETLELIQETLWEKGFLAKLQEYEPLDLTNQ